MTLRNACVLVAAALALSACSTPNFAGTVSASVASGDAKLPGGGSSGGNGGSNGGSGGSNASSGNNANLPGVKEVLVTPTGPMTVGIGTSTKLAATVNYVDGSSDSAVSMSSSDGTIISVNSTTGAVSALAAGTATVRISSTRNPQQGATVSFTVKPGATNVALAFIDPQTADLAVGDTVQLSAHLKLSDGTESPNVVWSTSDASKALVTNGLVTAVAAGTVTITATAADDPTKKATCKVTIK